MDSGNASATQPVPAVDVEAAVQAWCAREGDRVDPVRRHFIVALARRARAQEGEARRILESRVLDILSEYVAVAIDGKALGYYIGGSIMPSALREPAAAPHAGPLADLTAQLARKAAGRTGDAAFSAPPQALQYLRRAWSRLSADRRITQSLARLPENAGPLNSHQLVHRSLTLMRDASPQYLNQFMAYIDTLAWLEQMEGASAPAVGSAARAERGRRPARGGG